MEYIIFLALFLFLFIWLGILKHGHLKKHDRLIQNLESSIETQKSCIKLLTNSVWELENPPKYKVGQKIKDKNCIVTGVRAIHSTRVTTCGYFPSFWVYNAIDLKTGEPVSL